MMQLEAFIGKWIVGSTRLLLVCLSLTVMGLAFSGCGDSEWQPVWHEEKLPSGRTVKVTACNLVWGVEHDEPRATEKDCFAMEYVSAIPQAPLPEREAEAKEVFELIRATSEKWGLHTATLAGFPTLTRKGHYDFYLFEQQPGGAWTVSREDRKVFSTD
ncbi:MAG: hypothetical protein QM796_03025 [Chthoniobacteraceae bacterium]